MRHRSPTRSGVNDRGHRRPHPGMKELSCLLSLNDLTAREYRRHLLKQAHMTPLVQYTEKLRAIGNGTVSNFDPLDGGIQAQALFLFEKPGPMTDDMRAGRSGSGFISRDNDDPTANAISTFMLQAAIPREMTLLWNIVPWWNGTRRIAAVEHRAGIAALLALVALLPKLKVIVLVGRRAHRAEPSIAHLDVPIFKTAHPSPIVRASRPQLWASIPDQWAAAMPLFTQCS